MIAKQIRQAGERRKEAQGRSYRATAPQQGLKASQQHRETGCCCHTPEAGVWGRGAAELGLGARGELSHSFCCLGVRGGGAWCVSLSLTHCPTDPDDPSGSAATFLGVWCGSSMQSPTASWYCSRETSLASLSIISHPFCSVVGLAESSQSLPPSHS